MEAGRKAQADSESGPQEEGSEHREHQPSEHYG